MNKPDPGPRTGEVALQDSGKLRQPLWYSWALPFAGAAGVMIGASLLRPRAAASPASTG